MKIETTKSSSLTSLVLRGDFETDAAATFLDKIGELTAEVPPRVAVSFRYVKYLNSTALGSIVRARQLCRDLGGDLVIVRPSRLTHDIITKMGLDSVLPMFDDEQAAADHLARQDGDPARARSATKTLAEPGREAAQPTSIMFSFDYERASLFPGKSHHGVGVLDAVDGDGLRFRWHPAQHGSDASTAAAMFLKGSTMRNKLQVKMIRKEFFEGDSTVQNLTLHPTGDVTVEARWSRLPEADREALRRSTRDLAFLSQQVGEQAS